MIDHDQQIEKLYHPENFEKQVDEDDESELWREHNKEMQQMRDRRRNSIEKVFEALEFQGYSVRHITPYQIRINEILDIYPSNKRWHNIKTGKRGDLRVRIDKSEQLIKNLCRQ